MTTDDDIDRKRVLAEKLGDAIDHQGLFHPEFIGSTSDISKTLYMDRIDKRMAEGPVTMRELVDAVGLNAEVNAAGLADKLNTSAYRLVRPV